MHPPLTNPAGPGSVDLRGRVRTMDLGRSLTAALTARHWLALELEDLDPAPVLTEDDLDMTQLMLSELVANVVVHTRSNAVATVELRADDVLVMVTDDDPALPVLRHPDPHTANGRGLQIVDRAAAAWGVETRSPTGKTVWFTVPTL